MSTLELIATKIIKEQELIIGPMAWYEARKVNGINILNEKSGEVTLNSSNASGTIDQLVAQYERLFGRASREVCKEAAKPFLSELTSAEIPVSLN